MELKEQIEIMTHYLNGGEVEYSEDEKKQIAEALGWNPKVTLMMNDRLATIDEMISYIQHKGKNSLVENDSGE